MNLPESVRNLSRRLAKIEKEHVAPDLWSLFPEDVEAEMKQELAQERDEKMREEIRRFAESTTK